MIQIIQCGGQTPQLYQLLAPLVMSPEVLKENNNYPYKTGEDYSWFVLIEQKNVIGFIPVEQRGRRLVINNYYINPDRTELLVDILRYVVEKVDTSLPIEAVVQVRHKDLFEQLGFIVEKVWKLYVKMRKES